MIYASIVQGDGHHADFTSSGDDVRFDVLVENGILIVHVRDGAKSVRLRIDDPLLSALRKAVR
jgi:hypothetical protein